MKISMKTQKLKKLGHLGCLYARCITVGKTSFNKNLGGILKRKKCALFEKTLHWGKIFKKRDHFTAHMWKHDGVRRYKCFVPDCGSSFVYSETLTRHKEKEHSKIAR